MLCPPPNNRQSPFMVDLRGGLGLKCDSPLPTHSQHEMAFSQPKADRRSWNHGAKDANDDHELDVLAGSVSLPRLSQNIACKQFPVEIHPPFYGLRVEKGRIYTYRAFQWSGTGGAYFPPGRAERGRTELISRSGARSGVAVPRSVDPLASHLDNWPVPRQTKGKIPEKLVVCRADHSLRIDIYVLTPPAEAIASAASIYRSRSTMRTPV